MIKSGSAWDQQQITQFLRDTVIPLRLACLTGSGIPLVCSLWYLYEAGAIWCATQQSARVITFLEREPHCGFEVAPEAMPYRGVRGQGKAILSRDGEGEDVLLRLIDRYLGDRDSAFAAWLIERAASEVAVRIEPDWLTSWDFTRRMKA
jgi:nitroimidazol reductase NimA-like FMN-containing flavoprotein (pyridoxamine 5'-phosphate oxidase superfamily)